MLAGVPAAGGRATSGECVHRFGRGREARPVTAGGVRPCHATVGGVKLGQTPSATPASGWRLRPVQFAPSPLEFRLRSFFGMDANGNQRVQTVQDLGFLAPALRYRPRVGLSASGFGLGLKGSRVYGKWGRWWVIVWMS